MVGCLMWIPAFDTIFFATILLVTCRDDAANILLTAGQNDIRNHHGLLLPGCHMQSVKRDQVEIRNPQTVQPPSKPAHNPKLFPSTISVVCLMWVPAFDTIFFATILLVTRRDDAANILFTAGQNDICYHHGLLLPGCHMQSVKRDQVEIRPLRSRG